MTPMMQLLGGLLAVLSVLALSAESLSGRMQTDDAYLTWSAKQAEAIGTNAYKRGRVGGVFDMRMLKTERSYNYKLAATWLTPDVVRATARLLQLRSRLSEEETRALVAEAAAVPGTVVMVEIDPREGSGVIPNDWEAFLQPKGQPARAVRGVISPKLRDVKALAGVLRRNYDYDRFWVTFPSVENGSPVFSGPGLAELVVRIYDKEGRVEWPVPASILEMKQAWELERVPGSQPTDVRGISNTSSSEICRPGRSGVCSGPFSRRVSRVSRYVPFTSL